MIKAEFKKRGGSLCGFRVSGHSGYSVSGSDIVCAAVTSAVQFAVNLISEGFGVRSDLNVDGDSAVIDFGFDGGDERARKVAETLMQELTALQQDHPENIRVVETTLN